MGLCHANKKSAFGADRAFLIYRPEKAAPRESASSTP